MNKLLSPSWETAAQSTSGKVRLGVQRESESLSNCFFADLRNSRTHCEPMCVCVSVFDAYMKLSGYEMEESIKRETSGPLRDLLLAVGTRLHRLHIL